VPKIVRARPPRDDGEERKVRKLAGAPHAPADWSERARIVVLSWDGLGVPAIAGQLGCHPKKVRRWLHRFNAGGTGGLGDRPGAGRRRRITEAQRPAVIALARSAPPGRPARDGAGELAAEREDGPAQWTLDTLARAARDAGVAVGRSQTFADSDEIAHATEVATAQLNARARPWIWGRPQPEPRSYRRRFTYTL
jgi:transposase